MPQPPVPMASGASPGRECIRHLLPPSIQTFAISASKLFVSFCLVLCRRSVFWGATRVADGRRQTGLIQWWWSLTQTTTSRATVMKCTVWPSRCGTRRPLYTAPRTSRRAVSPTNRQVRLIRLLFTLFLSVCPFFNWFYRSDLVYNQSKSLESSQCLEGGGGVGARSNPEPALQPNTLAITNLTFGVMTNQLARSSGSCIWGHLIQLQE